MAAASVVEDEGNNEIDLISLPSIDLRCFAVDELLLVAQFSGHFPEADLCDIVVPKIDRTCFNESAGSRKQTYSNLGRSSKYSNRGLGTSVCAAAFNERRNFGLANTCSGHCCEVAVHDHLNKRIPVVGTTSSSAKAVSRRISKRTDTTESVAKVVACRRELENDVARRGNSGSQGRWTRNEGHSVDVLGSSQDSLRTNSDHSGMRRVANAERREVRLLRAVSNGTGQEIFDASCPSHLVKEGIPGTIPEACLSKILRQPIEAVNDSESEDIIARRNRVWCTANRDLRQEGLVTAKRIRGSLPETEGDRSFESRLLETKPGAERARKSAEEGYMLDLLAKMKGKWSSSERTWKIVDATGFPVGWTVRVGLRHKDGRTLFEYCDWRSPEGNEWPSFKDASAYLLASIGHDSTSEILVLLKPSRAISLDREISAAKKEGSTHSRGESHEDQFCGNISAFPRFVLPPSQ